MPRLNRRALIAGSLALAAPAHAFPDRTLRIISPFNPGGLNDITARALAQALTPVLGQSVVVENRAGAGGNIGALAAVRAAPDGHTLFLAILDIVAINPTAYRSLPYDAQRDLAPVSFVGHVPFVLMAGRSLPEIRDFAGFVAAAKAQPGRFSFGTWGVASTSHLAFERIARQAGIELLHVPFTGQAPAMQAVAAGQVDVMITPAGGGIALARDGLTRILAVIGQHRLELVPAAPTVRELGFDIASGLWQGVYVPVRTPAPIIAQLNEAIRAALRAPSFIEVMRGQAAVPEASTPEELAALTSREREAWGSVVRQVNAFVD